VTASPFLIDVVALLTAPGSRRRVPIETPVEWGVEMSDVGPSISADLALESVAPGVVVRGPLDTTVTHRCHRCLVEWTEPLEIDVLETFGIADEGDDYPIVKEQIDLEPALRDATLLELPVSPTCKPDCLGLCSTCGADLNTGSCPGHDEEIDSPFAELRELLEP
jgi:uncharacterized protein